MKKSSELILPKYSILYSSSNNIYDIIDEGYNLSGLNNIFFHPCEYQISQKIYKITLKKDISLFFDFEFKYFQKDRFIIRSSLKKIITDYDKYKLILKKLKEYNFDGYIQPQYGKYEKTNIFLFDNKDIFEIENEEYVETWNNVNIIEFCGNYPIFFVKYKPILKLNKSYEETIKLYLKFKKNELINKNNNLFYLLFLYSDIKYNDFEKIFQ